MRPTFVTVVLCRCKPNPWRTRAIGIATALVLLGGLVAYPVRAERQGQTTPPAKPAGPAGANPPAAPPLPFPDGATVAFVRLQGVLSDSKFGQCGNAALTALRSKDQATLASKQKELQDLQAKMNAPQGTASDEVKTQMKRDADRSQIELQALTKQFQADVTNKEQDLLNDFRLKAGPMIEAVRKDKGLTFILSPDQPGEILAADPALDLTSEVVKRLNATYPDCLPKAGNR